MIRAKDCDMVMSLSYGFVVEPNMESLKGSHNIAQGNALGNNASNPSQALKGRYISFGKVSQSSITPFQGLIGCVASHTKALPWAVLFSAFQAGLKENTETATPGSACGL